MARGAAAAQERPGALSMLAAAAALSGDVSTARRLAERVIALPVPAPVAGAAAAVVGGRSATASRPPSGGRVNGAGVDSSGGPGGDAEGGGGSLWEATNAQSARNVHQVSPESFGPSHALSVSECVLWASLSQYTLFWRLIR